MKTFHYLAHCCAVIAIAAMPQAELTADDWKGWMAYYNRPTKMVNDYSILG